MLSGALLAPFMIMLAWYFKIDIFYEPFHPLRHDDFGVSCFLPKNFGCARRTPFHDTFCSRNAIIVKQALDHLIFDRNVYLLI